MVIVSSLLQALKICRQACPPSILMRFSQGSIPESLVKKNSQRLLKGMTPKGGFISESAG